jgi:hypothetical protein
MGAKRQAKKQLELERRLEKQRATDSRKIKDAQVKRAAKDAKRRSNQEAWEAKSPTEQRNWLIGLGVAALLLVLGVIAISSNAESGSSDLPAPASRYEDCVERLEDMAAETGQSPRDLAQTLNGSRNVEEACRRNAREQGEDGG